MILIIDGPSCAGKSTLISLLLTNPLFKKIVSFTTRKPRPNETDGIDYNFISHDQFCEMIASNKFIEYASNHENMYGKTFESIKDIISSSLIPILDVDFKGLRTYIELFGRSHIISCFITAPIAELKKRMILRDSHIDDVRIQNGEIEVANFNNNCEMFDIYADTTAETLTKIAERIIRTATKRLEEEHMNKSE